MYQLSIEQRAVILAQYILETRDTVRGAAHHFGISKSTVHKDVTQRLEHIHPALFEGVKAILEEHKDERHIRGGIATREKYRSLKEARLNARASRVSCPPRSAAPQT